MRSVHRRKNTPCPFAFTLIELLVVIAVVLILISLILPKLWPMQQKAARASCARNVKALLEAVQLYTADPRYEGKWSITAGASAPSAYGNVFQKEGWNNLAQLICPSDSTGKAPKPAGYGAPLDMSGAGSAIDYWIVHSGNRTGSALTPFLSPGNNVLLIEKFSGASAWTGQDFHKEGGTVGRVNGSAEFLTTFPENTNDQGVSQSIANTDCTRYP